MEATEANQTKMSELNLRGSQGAPYLPGKEHVRGQN
jgi:hypothetical protein